MASIFKLRPFKDLLPDPGKILNQQATDEKKMVYARTNSNDYHLVYLPNHPPAGSDPGNSKVRLNLSVLVPAFSCNSADWTIQWLNPRDGTVPALAACQLVSSGIYDFVKPSNCLTCEWVLAIDRIKSQTPQGTLAGNALQVWPDFEGEGTSIWGQVIDESETPLQEPAKLSQSAGGFFRKQPVVARNGQGNFLLVWESEYQDGSQWGIFGRRFDAQGFPLGDEFQVNTHTDSDQVEPSAAISPTGEAIVVWMSFDQDGERGGIFAQQYSADGLTKGSEFQVNMASSGHQGAPLVGISSQGDFIVAWEEQTSEETKIFARQFNQWGVALGSEFQVAPTGLGDQILVGLEVRPDGAFTVTWESYNSLESSSTLHSRVFGHED